MNIEIKLGDTVQCIYTGFKGVAVAKTEFVNGCIQILITPKVKKDGSLCEDESIDSQSLKIIKKGPRHIMEVKKERSFTGGPRTTGFARRNH